MVYRYLYIDDIYWWFPLHYSSPTFLLFYLQLQLQTLDSTHWFILHTFPAYYCKVKINILVRELGGRAEAGRPLCDRFSLTTTAHFIVTLPDIFLGDAKRKCSAVIISKPKFQLASRQSSISLIHRPVTWRQNRTFVGKMKGRVMQKVIKQKIFGYLPWNITSTCTFVSRRGVL